MSPAGRRAPVAVGLTALVILVSRCGGQGGVDLSALEAQGAAGKAALDLIEAHGGLADFLALHDVEYAVEVEHLDDSGALRGTVRELHRFQAAPPPRYLLRRTGSQVVEMGLMADQGWVRLDGVAQQGERPAEVAREDLRLLSVLNRAPFCLADPGVRISLVPGPEAAEGSAHRLAVEFSRAGRERPERYVFFVDAASGLLARILFEERGELADFPLREARAVAFQSAAGARLVSSWSLAAAGSDGRVLGLPDRRWSVTELRTGNGFTDELYQVAAEP